MDTNIINNCLRNKWNCEVSISNDGIYGEIRIWRITGAVVFFAYAWAAFSGTTFEAHPEN